LAVSNPGREDETGRDRGLLRAALMRTLAPAAAGSAADALLNRFATVAVVLAADRSLLEDTAGLPRRTVDDLALLWDPGGGINTGRGLGELDGQYRRSLDRLRGSRRGSFLTAAQLEVKWAIRAARARRSSEGDPGGPVIAFRGAPGADTAKHAGRIFDALNWAKQEWPDMALATTGAKGAEKLAIK